LSAMAIKLPSSLAPGALEVGYGPNRSAVPHSPSAGLETK
jgi:hypothetical protein